jgi:hypothetical protein
MEQKIKISNGKEFVVKEILYKDMTENTSMNKAQSAKKLLQLSTGISDEEYNTLGMKDGLLLQKAVNEVNGFTEDFLSQKQQRKG